MDRVYDVTIREVREKTVAVKASSKEEAEKGCRVVVKHFCNTYG